MKERETLQPQNASIFYVTMKQSLFCFVFLNLFTLDTLKKNKLEKR